MNKAGTLFVRKIESIGHDNDFVEVYLSNMAKLVKDSITMHVTVPSSEQPKIGDQVLYTLG